MFEFQKAITGKKRVLSFRCSEELTDIIEDKFISPYKSYSINAIFADGLRRRMEKADWPVSSKWLDR